MDAAAWQLLALEVALVAVLAVLSLSESALQAIRTPTLLEQLAGRGRRGRRVGTMGERATRYLAAVQVTEFFVIFAYAGVAAAFIAPRLSDLLGFFGLDVAFTAVSAVIVTVAILSLIAVLFGIFVPRAIGTRHAARAMLMLVWPLELITWITSPLVVILFALTDLFTRPFGANTRGESVVSEDEIKALVETGEEQGVLEIGERDMIRSIFDLDDKQVHEVMVPRTDINAIDVNTPGPEVLDLIVRVGHSRIPIYEGSSDAIIGVLYVKDLFRRFSRGDRQIDLRELLRTAHFVPETKNVADLLREMQQEKVHIAIVVDEYGGTAGLVTIEDLVEEIVGEIRDEYDVEQELVLPVSEDEVIMDARVPFDDVRELFAIDVPESADYDTLGGFIVQQLGRLPRPGETVDTPTVRFHIESVEGRRIRRVRAIRTPAREPV